MKNPGIKTGPVDHSGIKVDEKYWIAEIDSEPVKDITIRNVPGSQGSIFYSGKWWPGTKYLYSFEDIFRTKREALEKARELFIEMTKKIDLELEGNDE